MPGLGTQHLGPGACWKGLLGTDHLGPGACWKDLLGTDHPDLFVAVRMAEGSVNYHLNSYLGEETLRLLSDRC